MDVNSVKESTTNGPPSPSVPSRNVKSPVSIGTIENNVSGGVFSPVKFSGVTGMGSLRQKPTNSTITSVALKNTFSGIPRRNTYNYNEKSASTEKTALDTPSR